MTTDYVAPIQSECSTIQDSAADELEWLAIEAAAVRIHGYLYYAPDGYNYPKRPDAPGSAYWTGPRASTKAVAGAYKLPSGSAAVPARAKSPDMASRQLEAFPSVTYSPRKLAPAYQAHD